MSKPVRSSRGPSVRPALLQEPAGARMRCLTCERRCEIAPGGRGWCRTRRNRDGLLETLTYGALSSLSVNPIEKKPLYHFHPGTVALTSGSWSCNFDCPWCQNAAISKVAPGPARFLPPQEFVQRALALECHGTSISLNEPTLSLEWSLDVFRLAREQGLYNTYVTNGYMTATALELLLEAGLDAMNVDLKGDALAVRRYCGADVEKVWRNCRLALEAGIWVEITTLLIPGVNDADEAVHATAERIVADLGPDVPWHVSRYYPAYRFDAPPTPLSSLERACQFGKEAGLKFVYMGNVPGRVETLRRLHNTLCPECGALLIERWMLSAKAVRLDGGCCPECRTRLPGVWS